MLFVFNSVVTAEIDRMRSVYSRGNQVIRLQSAEGDRCNNPFARPSERQEAQCDVSPTQNRTEYVYIRLEMILSVQSIQMDIFHQNIL